MGTPTFSISEALHFGWRTTRAHFWFFAQVIIIITLVSYGPGLIMQSFDRIELPTVVTLFFFLAGIVLWVIQLLISIGLTRIVLGFVDSRKTDIAELFSGARFLVNYVLATFAYALAVAAGFVLLVVPGVILMVRLQLFSYVIIDKDQGPIESLKESWKMTRGAFWHLALLWLAMLGINILGVIALGIGLLWSIPTTMLAAGWVYRRLSQRMHA
ncbi:MAG: DUF975 family protein [Patescibacteria group bacterium]